MRSRIATVLALLCLLPAGRAAVAQEAEDPWERFLQDRPAFFEALAPPFVECFKRRDSAIDPLSPIFHGCLDWHSAAHAAYSHHVVYHRTGDGTFLTLAEDQIAPGGVSLIPAEFQYQRAKGLDLPLTENPYGFGWFLQLVREREISTGKRDFREMADHAAAQMVNWFRARANLGDANGFIQNEAHSNYSWSLINLDVWARHTGDPLLRAAVRDATAPLFNPSLDTSCPVSRDRQTNRTGFQPACLMRLVAVGHVWGEQARDWVMARLPEEGGLNIPRVTTPANCHAGGLNFSRAFALYQLYRITGDTAYRDNYADLVRYHVGRPDLYIDPSYAGNPGYLCYSHWVAQFGVRAISLSYEDAPGTPPEILPAGQTSVSITGAQRQGDLLRVNGAAAFAHQPFVTLGTDPSGDTQVPGAAGHDLTSASASTTLDGRLRLRFGVASLPSVTNRGPRTSYSWAFCADASCYEIDAWSTGGSDVEPEVEVRRCATPACTPAGQTPTTIDATADFNGAGRSVTVHVLLDDLGIAPGASITPASPAGSPVFTSMGTRHGPGDSLSYSAAYEAADRLVSLAVGPPGQDPAVVEYVAPAEIDGAGGYTGVVDLAGLGSGTRTLYARACFGPNNCAYATRQLTI